MKVSELRDRDSDGLKAMLAELRENLFALRIQKSTGQLENTAKVGATKRDIARVSTVLRQKAQEKE